MTASPSNYLINSRHCDGGDLLVDDTDNRQFTRIITRIKHRAVEKKRM